MNEYAKLRYNPFDVPMGTVIWKHYPKLSRRHWLSTVPKELFKKKEDGEPPTEKELSLLVSYVILLVDKASPFYSVTDYEERRDACIHALRIPHSGMVYKAIKSLHWWYELVMTDYFHVSNDPDFETWFSLKMSAHHAKVFLRRPIINNEISLRTQLINTIEKNDQQILALERKLFHDAGPDIQEMVVEAVTSDLYQPYAELHAQNYPIS